MSATQINIVREKKKSNFSEYKLEKTVISGCLCRVVYESFLTARLRLKLSNADIIQYDEVTFKNDEHPGGGCNIVFLSAIELSDTSIFLSLLCFRQIIGS